MWTDEELEALEGTELEGQPEADRCEPSMPISTYDSTPDPTPDSKQRSLALSPRSTPLPSPLNLPPSREAMDEDFEANVSDLSKRYGLPR